MGIEVLTTKERDEVLVAKSSLRAVRGNVMKERGVALLIHVARIPFVGEGGNGIDSPVEKDAELGVAKPIRGLVAGEGLPVCAEGAMGIRRQHPGYLLLHPPLIGRRGNTRGE